ncbi:putative zinc-binding metallopeptidase [Bradyrhizobium sp. PMVTL-01]|uniref:putative zinc-binding metallopeptidase n=1 Tax=Bradyrhizobium sp. PMVTL-01 TaxID=3434999 RepID=UPI003F6E5580
MREFNCPYCRTQLAFEQIECVGCRMPAVFDPNRIAMVRSEEVESCSNRQIIGCNWCRVSNRYYCESCSLTRVIPSTANSRNVWLWKRVEQAKRRLLYDLRRLRLPLCSKQGMQVSFEILSDEHGPVLTGHRAGLITLNLAEADDVERESRRVSMRETYRTLLGHFRHEIGHFYWYVLIDEARLHAPFRLVFGDETNSYDDALAAYYARQDRSHDPASHISLYATSHPWEDWAETFAHFLHIVATLDSLAGLPLSLETRARETLRDPYLESDFDALLDLWSPLARSINVLNRSLGLAEAYPFDISPAVKGKLHLVHMALVAFRNRA